MHQQEPQTQTTQITRANPENLKSWLNPKVEKYTRPCPQEGKQSWVIFFC